MKERKEEKIVSIVVSYKSLHCRRIIAWASDIRNLKDTVYALIEIVQPLDSVLSDELLTKRWSKVPKALGVSTADESNMFVSKLHMHLSQLSVVDALATELAGNEPETRLRLSICFCTRIHVISGQPTSARSAILPSG
jgi:hypothetical protein